MYPLDWPDSSPHTYFCFAKHLLQTSLVHLGLVPEPKGIIGMRKSIWAGIGQRLAFPSVTGTVLSPNEELVDECDR